MPSFSLFPKHASTIDDGRSYSPSFQSSRQHSPSTSISADSFLSMPYTECTSLGSPTIVPTANPLRLYQELEAIDSRNLSTKPTQYDKTENSVPRNLRRRSSCSSYYSVDDKPSAPLQSWIDLSDDEEEKADEKGATSIIRRRGSIKEGIQTRVPELKRSKTFCAPTRTPRMSKVERDIMEMLSIRELEEKDKVGREMEVAHMEEDDLKSLKAPRKSLAIPSFRPKRQFLGKWMGKLKKSLIPNDPPEWKEKIKPSYFNYMI